MRFLKVINVVEWRLLVKSFDRPNVAILCHGDFSRSMFSSFDNRKYFIKNIFLTNWLHLIDKIIVNNFEYQHLWGLF